MSEWAECVTGTLALSKAEQKNWRAVIADPTTFGDWPWPKAIDPTPTNVSKLLVALDKSKRFGTKLFVTEGPHEVTVRARFTSETVFRCQTLVLALRAAAMLGGKGRVFIVNASEPPMRPPLTGGVWVLDLDGRSSRFRELRGAEKQRANSDPELFALVSSFDDDLPRAPEPKTARREKKQLSAKSAKRGLVARVSKKMTTDAALATAEQLLEQVLGEADAADTLWKAWRPMRARAPIAGTRAATRDIEAKFRFRLGQALIRIERAHVDGKTLREELASATRKEWPEPRAFYAALDALARARKH